MFVMGIHVEWFYPNLDLIVRHCSSSRVELVFDAFSLSSRPLWSLNVNALCCLLLREVRRLFFRT